MTIRDIVTTIEAVKFVDGKDSIVSIGERVGLAIVRALDSDEQVVVSLKGLRGPSSSFYNILLRVVGERKGVDAILDRLVFEFDSMPQEGTFLRSRDSVIAFLRADEGTRRTG